MYLFYHSRYVNAGLYYLRQLFFARYDIKVHTDKGTYSGNNNGDNRHTCLSPIERDAFFF